MAASSATESVDWRILCETAPTASIFLAPDFPRFTVVAASNDFLKLVYAKREDLVGRGLWECFEPYVAAIVSSLERVVKERVRVSLPALRFDIRRPEELGGGQEERWWCPLYSPMCDAAGELRYVCIRLEDVTGFMAKNCEAKQATGPRSPPSPQILDEMEQMMSRRTQEVEAANERLAHANEELKKLNGHLEQARRGAEAASRTKAEFLANISHEIRTPLNGILGFAQLLVRDDGATATSREHAQLIHRAGEHLLGLLNDILDLAKMEAGKMQLQPRAADLRELLREVALLMSPQCEQRGLQLRLNLDDTLPTAIWGDTMRIRQAVLNLLGNAIKFTNAGYVSLEAKAEPASTILPNRDPDVVRLQICVRDSGAGIAPEDLPALFTRFEQGRQGGTAHGTGLGLAISRQLALMMSGDIQVESQLGQGSCFRLQVVVQVLPAEHLQQLSEEGPWCSLEQVSHEYADSPILVVDDIEMNRRLLRTALERMGFKNIAEAQNGAEAIAVAKETWPRVVLMDLCMPVLDGFQAAQGLRKLPGGDTLPILAVSASMLDRNSLEDGQAPLFDHFLPKPVRLEELQRSLTFHAGFRFRRHSSGTNSLSESGESSPLIRSRRVLVVDDNTLNQRLVSAVLQRAGHMVDVCDSGEEAVQKLERNPALAYDVIVMDRHMPSMDGLEATRLIRNSLSSSRKALIVGMSAEPEGSDGTAEFRQAGVNAYVSKPFRSEELVSLVEGRTSKDRSIRV